MAALRLVHSAREVTLLPLSQMGCDREERGALAVLRHLVIANQRPETGAWAHAFTIATERWGDMAGLTIAGAASDLVQALLGQVPDLRVQDPLDAQARLLLTPAEAALLRLLRAMRQDITPLARDEVLTLTGGRMDPKLITAALQLARALPALQRAPVWHAAHAGLRLVQ